MDELELQVPLKGFDDVTPIPQDDGPNPVVPIAYRHNYKVAGDYLRAFQVSGETSERAFSITRLVLEHNPSHYTAWWFRRRCVFALGIDLAKELDVAEDIAGYNPKNYQAWFNNNDSGFGCGDRARYHRRALTERRGDPGNEIEYVDRVVAEDPKNYHAWSHRQWVLQEFGILDTEEGRRSELLAVDALLEEDLRNNSAWNHRWFILHSSLGQNDFLSNEAVRSELAYALGYAQHAPSNESPWNYLRGFFRASARSYAEFPEVEKTARSLQETNLGAKSPHVHSLLAEIYEREGTEEALNEAINALQRLRNELDVIRAKYWETRLRAVTCRLADLVTSTA